MRTLDDDDFGHGVVDLDVHFVEKDVEEGLVELAGLVVGELVDVLVDGELALEFLLDELEVLEAVPDERHVLVEHEDLGEGAVEDILNVIATLMLFLRRRMISCSEMGCSTLVRLWKILL